jgi:DMSO reductase anchor subunit
VHLLEAPHTQENFVMRAMGYRIARRHAARLRLWAEGLAFALPLALAMAFLLLPEGAHELAAPMAVLAALSATARALAERWLFFAEARHVVTLYYGAREI